MARCGCTGGCSCSVIGSVTATVTTTVVGNGAVGTPYQIISEVIPGSISGGGSNTGEICVTDEIFAGGADPTGVLDSSAAFLACFQAAYDSRTADPIGLPVMASKAKICIPPGIFLIQTPEAMMQLMGAGQRMQGLIWQGAGIGATQIVVDIGGGILMRNIDQFLQLTFRDMEFLSTATFGAIDKPIWMSSESAGGPKDLLLENVKFVGEWEAGIALSGDNTNAQMGFDRLIIRNAAFTNGFLYSDSGFSAQAFVNYWFSKCSVYIKRGYFVNADGFMGHIHVRDSLIACSIDDGTGSAVTLFHLGQNSQDGNSSYFTLDTVYCELHESDQKLLDSNWRNGAIELRNTSWNSGGTGDFDELTSTSIEIRAEVNGHARVRLIGCGSKGKHLYHHGASTSKGPSTAIYEDTTFQGAEKAADIIEYVADGGTNHLGNRTPVEFRRCVFTDAADTSQERTDQVFGAGRSRQAAAKEYLAKFVSVRGDLPRASDALPIVQIPEDAIILGTSLIVREGGVTDTVWQFEIVTTEGTPTVLGSFPSGGAQLANGQYQENILSVPFVVKDAVPATTELRRTLTMSSTYVGAVGVVADLVVRYRA